MRNAAQEIKERLKTRPESIGEIKATLEQQLQSESAEPAVRMRAMELLGMLYSSLKDSLSRSTAAADRMYEERIGQGVEAEEVPRAPELPGQGQD